MNKIGVHFGYFNRDWNTDFIKRIEQVKKIGLDILEVAPDLDVPGKIAAISWKSPIKNAVL